MSERPRFYKRKSVQIGAVVVAIPILALAWWLGSPLLIDQVVDEPFPRAAMAVVPDDMTEEEVELAMIEAEATDAPAYENMPEPEHAVTTTMPAPATTTQTSEGTTAASDPTSGETDTTPATTAAPLEEEPAEEPEAQPVEPEPTGPVALVTGALTDADTFHKGSGQVTLYRLEDGSHVIRLEDIEVTNGPDLHVLLTPTHGVTDRSDLQEAGYVDLGSLKGNIGSQNYDVPPDYEIPEELTVVIYCVPFHVIFTTAELA